MLRTEFEFTLPCGVVDETGTLRRDGMMRLSTALDELEAMRDQVSRQQSAVSGPETDLCQRRGSPRLPARTPR